MEKNLKRSPLSRILIGCVEVFAALLVLLLIAVGISAFVCSREIKVTTYDAALEGIESPARLVVVSDLHGETFGEDNEKLLTLVREQTPDAIVLLGDLVPVRCTQEDAAFIVHVTQQMQEIAQVYFAMGNHELSFIQAYGDDWIEEVRGTGAIVLDEEWGDFQLCGNTVRFAGSLGHGYLFGRTKEEFLASEDYALLTVMEESPFPAILLGHRPDIVALSDGPKRWHIDLVLSGHTHGGVIRIPGLGGLYAPMQGFRPRYDYGDFMLNDRMRMIITSGLAGYDKIPRIFNLPEICVIDLHAP